MRYLFLFLIIYSWGCQAPEIKTSQNKFFDLKEYIQYEIKELSDQSIDKNITLNGVHETKKIDTPDLQLEFSELLASDINKAAWLDKFEKTSKGNKTIYKNIDQSMEIKLMEILYQSKKEQEVEYIFIKKEKKNLLNHSVKELEYSPRKWIKTTSIRETISDDQPDTLIVEVKFLP